MPPWLENTVFELLLPNAMFSQKSIFFKYKALFDSLLKCSSKLYLLDSNSYSHPHPPQLPSYLFFSPFLPSIYFFCPLFPFLFGPEIKMEGSQWQYNALWLPIHLKTKVYKEIMFTHDAIYKTI